MEIKLREVVLDALKEILNIGVGHAAGTLHELIEMPIKLSVPHVTVISCDDSLATTCNYGSESMAMVEMGFDGTLQGSAVLGFPTDGASKLVSLVTGEDDEVAKLEALRSEALSEIGNIVLNSVMGSIANMLQQPLNYSVPVFSEKTIVDIDKLYGQDRNGAILFANTHFIVEELDLQGDILIVFDLGSFETFKARIEAYLGEEFDWAPA